MKAILIDSKKQIIMEVWIDQKNALEEMQAHVGGNIELAHSIDENTNIFVNEEGLFENNSSYFYYNGAHQPFAGNGLIIQDHGSKERYQDLEMNISEVEEKVRFISEAEMQKFFRE